MQINSYVFSYQYFLEIFPSDFFFGTDCLSEELFQPFQVAFVETCLPPITEHRKKLVRQINLKQIDINIQKRVNNYIWINLEITFLYSP